MTVPFLSLRDAYLEVKEEADAAVLRVLDSGQYIGGPEVEAFESEFAAYVGARHCVGVGNGLDAITLALLAHDIRPGDEVLVPSNTFIATWFGATHARAVPVAVAPDPQTHVVVADAFERALTARTRALIPVHLYGLPADMPALVDLARERNLLLVDDAAQAHGAAIGSRRVGGFGSTTTWSFYPGKNLGALGDAGAVTTDDDRIAASIRQLRNYGSTVKYLHDVVGFNSRLDPIQAAVLRVKLRHLDEWNARRRERAALYCSLLAGVGDLRLPTVPSGRTHAFHLFVVRTGVRERLRAFLDARGIGTIIHYPKPPHLQGAYQSAGIDPERWTSTTKDAEQVLSLPMGPQLSMDQVTMVAEAVKAFFAT